MTYLGRESPHVPAALVLDSDAVAVLEAHSRREVRKVGPAIIEIDRLSGYEWYKKASHPRVNRLWFDVRRLQAMVEGWRLSRG